MTKEEKAKVCEILGFSKALQITRPDAKQTQKITIITTIMIGGSRIGQRPPALLPIHQI